MLSVLGGVFAMQSCAGEGGPIGGTPGTGPGVTQQFLALLPVGQQGASYVGTNRCGDCHNGQTGGETFLAHWQETMHKTVNVGCEQCHGPGSNHASNPAKTNILTYPKVVSSVVCAQCHGKIFDEWQFSQHSKLVLSPVQSAAQSPAGQKNSRCIACHSGLFRTQTVEAGINVATMPDADIRAQAEHTLNDVPHVATCATCHDPHKNTGKLSDNGKEVQLRRQVFNADTSPIAPGTNAASFTNFDHVCAQCHNGRGTNPSDTALTSGTARPSMHDSNQYNMLMGIGGVEGAGNPAGNSAHRNIAGQCSTCHMPDSRHTFTVSYDRSCTPCHTAADAAARVVAVRGEIVSRLYNLLNRLEAWSQLTFGDPDLWEYTATITAEGKTPPNQSLVPIQVKRARHNYYFVLRDACFGPHNAPYSNHLITVANENLDAINAPKVGPKTREPSHSQKMQVFYRQLETLKRLTREEGH
ncbi:MAG TPA: multiheme c-type cytochrome [Fimbriimonadaceae bacterium]|nr:multiheme c-type cytochrome [Fimbriimonadaceae bacterium]